MDMRAISMVVVGWSVSPSDLGMQRDRPGCPLRLGGVRGSEVSIQGGMEWTEWVAFKMVDSRVVDGEGGGWYG